MSLFNPFHDLGRHKICDVSSDVGKISYFAKLEFIPIVSLKTERQ
jgi:hypothetical protein